MPPVKVLLVDDHTLFRKGLSSLLRRQKGIKVVGEAGSGEEGIRLAQRTRPDVILMDLNMPHRNGIEATRAIRDLLPGARIMMLTVSEDDENLFAAIKAGARGYLLKSIEPEPLVKAIHALTRGEPVVPHAMASKLLTEFSAMANRADRPPEAKTASLTSRETEILQWLAKGQSNKEIAGHLGISDHTVKVHLKNILRKLNMNSRVQAAVYAYREGLMAEAPAPPPARLKGLPS